MKKLAVCAAMSGVLVLAGAGSCSDREPREYYPVEIGDCDADDKVGVWDTEDCGPSPEPRRTKAAPKPTRRR